MRFNLVLFLFSLFLWSGLSHSREISFDDIPRLIESNNGKIAAKDHELKGEERLTGSFSRSFVPDLKVFAGSEKFDSQGLGDHSSQFYGVTTRVNLFNGMRDYWEGKRRSEGVKLARLEKLTSINEAIFEARQSFLKVVEALKIKEVLEESLSRISSIEGKVKAKVRGGVISKSDLTALTLLKVGFSEDLRELGRMSEFEKARLKTLLGVENIDNIVVDEKLLTLREEKSVNERSKAEISLLAKQYQIQSSIYEKASKVESNAIFPSLDLYASYQRQPFSQREILIEENRDELRAGVMATWSLGESFEKRRLGQKLNWNAKAAQELSEYHKRKADNFILALEEKKRLLRESILDLKKEINLSQGYYSQISSEYLRGIKSTADLTAAFSQILSLKRKQVELIVSYRVADAQIEALMGGS